MNLRRKDVIKVVKLQHDTRPVDEPYLREVAWEYAARWLPSSDYPTVASRLGTFSQETDAAARICSLLLKGLDVDADAELAENGVAESAIVRVELFWDPNSADQRRGAVFFDSTGQTVMHVMHALLGYNGSGPTLSKCLLRQLGVEQAMFDELNGRLQNQAYYVILSREATLTHDDGVEVAQRSGPVSDTWRWWRVR